LFAQNELNLSGLGELATCSTNQRKVEKLTAKNDQNLSLIIPEVAQEKTGRKDFIIPQIFARNGFGQLRRMCGFAFGL
jgi:hypothetical protein